MSKHNLKMQQWIVRSWLTRPEFETKSYSQEQLEVYKKYYNWFDEFFTLIWEEDLPEENEDWFTLNALIQYMKKMVDDWYQMFIVDSLKLIKKDNSFSWSENERYSKCVKSVKEFKNLNPCCVILIHHNNKFWKTFDWSQDLENFVDWRISVNKYIDPSADWISIFHQTKIRIHKERIWNELEFTFDYDRWNLIYNCHWYITEDL